MAVEPVEQVDVFRSPPVAPAAGTVIGKRECPVCALAMSVEASDGVTIDRCADHGIWFDGGELAAVLEHAGMHSLRGWLKRLFT